MADEFSTTTENTNISFHKLNGRTVTTQKLSKIPKSTRICKRILDLIFILPMMIFFLPLLTMLSIGYLISFIFYPQDRGPIFFRVFRKTRGRLFVIYKFRLSRMDWLKSRTLSEEQINNIAAHLNPDERQKFRDNQLYWLEDSGNEKTKFGRILKKIYLDELPQVLNILKGEMTLVGPRPFALYDARNMPDEGGKVLFDGQKFEYSFKEKMVSGLTGYYQLNKDERALENYKQFMIEGIKLDQKYFEELVSKNCIKVVLNDLSIIFRTIAIIWQAKGI